MLHIHVFISGKGNYETFKRTLKHYPISKIIILKGKNNVPEDAKEAHRLIRNDCENVEIGFEEIEYKDDDVEDEITTLINITKKSCEDTFYFNVTGGKKPEAIMAVIASLWVSGKAYYWPESGGSPLEFPKPLVSVNDLSKNRLHIEILECIINNPQNQSKLRTTIKKLPGTSKDLSPQALSNSIKALETYGLVKKDRKGRETTVEITLSGKIAYYMVMK